MVNIWEHTLTVDVLETIEVYDLKVGTCSQLNVCMMSTRSMSFTDVCPRPLRFHQFQTFLSNPTCRSKLNFMWRLHGKEKLKFVQMVQDTWPRWSPCPYMVKTIKHLLWNPSADVRETWYTALGTRVLPILFVQIITLGWPLSFLHKCQIWFFMHFYGSRLKWWSTADTQKLATGAHMSLDISLLHVLVECCYLFDNWIVRI